MRLRRRWAERNRTGWRIDNFYIMAIAIKKREGESVGSLLYRFNRRTKQSGVLREARRRRFAGRAENKRRRRVSALYRSKKFEEARLEKKFGTS